jgi:hypothetical protein
MLIGYTKILFPMFESRFRIFATAISKSKPSYYWLRDFSSGTKHHVNSDMNLTQPAKF